MLDEAHIALRRREIADYADTIRILKEQGVDPKQIADAERDLAEMRRKFASEVGK